MPSPIERRPGTSGPGADEEPRARTVRLVVRYVTWSTLVILVATPLAIGLGPLQRGLVIRLAAALVGGLILLDLTRFIRSLHAAQPPSRFEAAARRPSSRPPEDRHFRDVQDEIRAGAASEIYFGRVLWPRLLALAERAPHRPVLPPPPRTRLRALLRRGPTVAQIGALVAALEREPDDPAPTIPAGTSGAFRGRGVLGGQGEASEAPRTRA